MDESDSDQEVEQLQYKMIILGDGAVGKTSLAQRFTNDNFSNVYKQTIGLDFFLKKIDIPDNIQVSLQLWDIGGQTSGGKMIRNYIYGAHAVLLVYDITNYESFQNLEDWYRLITQAFKGEEMPMVALVGNKCDLSHLCAVKTELQNQFALENDMECFSCSAKSGDKVDSLFFQMAANLAGVVLSKSEVEISTPIVKAEIVNHKQNDESVTAPDIRKHNKNCIVQ